MTDGKGRVVNFKNTVIIMTSNIGSQYIEKMESIGFTNNSTEQSYMQMKDKVLESLKDHFRPEFLNRIDDTIVFDVLSKDVIRQIVNIRVNIVRERLLAKGITLEISDEAFDLMAREGYNPQYGARPLNRVIQTKILNPVATFIISNNVGKGDSVIVGVKNGELDIQAKKMKSRKSSTVIPRQKMQM
jgi:ATP-dependent Clp protease ATP-binding subunit ClpC